MNKYKKVSISYERWKGDWPPSDPAGLLEWFRDKIDAVPEHSRRSLSIDITAYENYGGAEAKINFTFTRPETEQEEAEREAAEDAAARARRDNDLAKLRELKDKYEQ